ELIARIFGQIGIGALVIDINARRMGSHSAESSEAPPRLANQRQGSRVLQCKSRCEGFHRLRLCVKWWTMLVDLHVHTKLSSDSNVAPEQYLAAAAERTPRLGAICFTEHRLLPEDAEHDRTYDELAERFGVHIFKGVEADTKLGHLLIFGINKEIRRRFDLSDR